MKNYIFNQFRGLGDILFIMQIAQEEVAKGNRVLIPVESHYLPIKKHFPGVEFIDKKDLNIQYKSMQEHNVEFLGVKWRTIPFRFANDILNVPYTECMKAKYWFWDLYVNGALPIGFQKNEGWRRWNEYNFLRDQQAEEKLFSYLNPDNVPFVLVNRNFRTNFSGKAQDMKIPSGLKVVEMRNLNGFTLIDWSLLLERATEIHTVGTSINYLIEKLNIDCPIHLYKRLPEENHFDNYKYILTDKYKYTLNI